MSVLDRIRTHETRMRSGAVVGALIVIVILVGWNAATRFAAGESEYYATVSQVIATLFIAVFLDSFTAEHPLWKDKLDRALVLTLLGISLLGMFACVRGLLHAGNSVMTGLAAAGVAACLLLVALALGQRIHSFANRDAVQTQPLTIVLIFVAAVGGLFIFL